jgi:hypothetical protein
MVIKINLRKFSKRKAVPPLDGPLTDLAGKVRPPDEEQLPASTPPLLPSQLIDHGKAPKGSDSHPPIARVLPMATMLIDHGKVLPLPDSHPPLRTVRPPTSRLIDHGKAAKSPGSRPPRSSGPQPPV